MSGDIVGLHLDTPEARAPMADFDPMPDPRRPDLRARAEAAEARAQKLAEAITDALADLTPGFAPYAVLSDALKGSENTDG